MWFRRGRIRTRSTGATPEPISQALLQCCITTLRTTAAAIAILIETPGTVLRLSGFFDADDSCENSQDEQRKPHGSLLFASAENPSAPYLFPAPSAKGATDCGEHRQAARAVRAE